MVAHGFTHFHLDLRVRAAAGTEPPGDGAWWPLVDLDAAAGLPTLFARAAALGLAALGMSAL
jgi:A/G-specific adenine glycosylase